MTEVVWVTAVHQNRAQRFTEGQMWLVASPLISVCYQVTLETEKKWDRALAPKHAESGQKQEEREIQNSREQLADKVT